jgi:hypothetical protein
LPPGTALLLEGEVAPPVPLSLPVICLREAAWLWLA